MDWFKDKILPLRERLIALANSVLADRDEAEDIVQETFIKIWSNKTKLKKHANIKALVYVMTKNLALNRRKIIARNRQFTLDNIASEVEQNVYTSEVEDKTKVILKIIETLPSLQKSIFRLKHIKGYEVEEIAQITGSTVEAVRMNLSRARKKIRDIYLNKKI